MFLGHFAAAYASKKIDPTPSLGMSFLAAQWLDLLWPLLLLTGTEKVDLNNTPGAVIPLSFTHYPVSHSLLAVAGWAAIFGGLYFLFTKNGRGAWVIGTLVLSHWVLDWLVHVPDLPLSPFSTAKTGLGLWQHKMIELVLELLFFGIAAALYLRATVPNNRKGTLATWSLLIFLVLIQLLNAFGPPPTAVEPIAYVGLSQWLLVAWAWWADANRHSAAS
jgi:membrane-bound metal-dependent hydrolase YbcI (DUF457 family)